MDGSITGGKKPPVLPSLQIRSLFALVQSSGGSTQASPERIRKPEMLRRDTVRHSIFITGASGFMGQRLSAELVRRGHTVRGLVRQGSEKRVVPGSEVVTGDPLDASTYGHHIIGADTFVQLVGVAHPSPAKAAQFRSIDLRSAQQAVSAAAGAGIRHFVYVSVAHPAPVMREYIAARTEGEEAIRASGLNATILRPWYVLGPGRRWPLLLLPAYWILGALPNTRKTARRLGLVTLTQMVRTMANAIERPPSGVRVVEVPQIRLGLV